MTTILYNAICRLTRKEVEKIKNKLVTKRRKSREKPEKTCSCAAAVLSFPKRGTRRKGGTETDETESSYVARCAAAPVRLRRADGERRGSVRKRRSAGSRGAAEDIDAAANGSFPEPLPKPVTEPIPKPHARTDAEACAEPDASAAAHAGAAGAL